MIVVAVFGGLGNQMFQYACAKAMALRNNTELKVCRLHLELAYQKRKKVTIRDFELNVFEDIAPDAGFLDVNMRAPFIGVRRKYFFLANEFLNPFYIGERQPFVLQSIPKQKQAYLYGYWQSEKYFYDFENDIRQSFRFKQTTSEQNRKFAEQIKASNAVSVHIRLSDYGDNILPLEYYTQAIAIMNEHFPDCTFFVFSDEPERAKAYFTDSKFVLINGNEGANCYADMQLMSLCKHHIIANSSFSWWGAWLNPSAQKLVIAPKVWNKNGGPTKDLIPANWIRI